MKSSKKDVVWQRFMEAGSKLGCHQIPQRSFFYKGYQFPVCARCTGILLAYPFACLAFFRHKKFPVWLCFLGSSTMVLDGMIQYAGILDSTNKRRFITGLCGGFGLALGRLRICQMIYTIISALFCPWKK